MNTEKIFKRLFVFVVGMMIIGILLLFATGAIAATPPERWTLQEVASYAERLAAEGGGTGTADVSGLQPIASMTDYAGKSGANVASTAFTLTLDQNMLGSSASLTAHVAKSTDAHGATETITQSLTIGSGPVDAYVRHVGTGTIGIASYVVIPPELATPTGPVATGTLWNDGNVGKLKCYDGSAWNALW